MAVALENSYIGSNSDVTTLEITSVVVPVRSNRAIYVRITGCTNGDDDGEFATAVAWDVAGVNEAFTLVGEDQSLRNTVAIWRLLAPTEKTAIITVTYGSTLANDLGTVVRVDVFSSVDQTTPNDSWETPSSGTNAVPSHTVSNTASGDYCMDIIAQQDGPQDNPLTETGPGTQDYQVNLDQHRAAGSSFVATGSTVAFSWTLPFVDTWMEGGLSINPASLNIVITPGVAAISVAGFAPTILTPNPVTVSPGVAAISVAGFAPSILTPRVVAPGIAAMVVDGFAPSILTPRVVSPGVAAIAVDGFVPDILTGTIVTPGVAAIDVIGFVPAIAVSDHKLILPGLAVIVVDGFAPVVVASDHKLILPGVAAIAVDGFAPTVLTDIRVMPGVAAIVVDGFAPTIVIPNPITINPDTGVITVTGFVPAINIGAGITIQPGVAAIAVDGFAPSILTPRVVAPGVAAISVTGFVPSILAPRVVQPGTGVISVTGFAPSILLPKVVQPGVAVVSIDGFAPLIIIPTDVVIVPGVAVIDVTGFVPLIVATISFVVPSRVLFDLIHSRSATDDTTRQLHSLSRLRTILVEDETT